MTRLAGLWRQVRRVRPDGQNGRTISLTSGLSAWRPANRLSGSSLVTVAIFEFQSQTLKNGPPYGVGPAPPETQKMEKNFFQIFYFSFIGTCKGMFEFIQKHFFRHVFLFYLTFIPILRYFEKVPRPPKRTKMKEKMRNLASKSVFLSIRTSLYMFQ